MSYITKIENYKFYIDYYNNHLNIIIMSVFLFSRIPESLRSYAELWNSKHSSEVLTGISERLPGLELALAIHSSNITDENNKAPETKRIIEERLNKLDILFLTVMTKNLPSKSDYGLFLEVSKSYQDLKYRATKLGIKIPTFC